MIKSIIKKEWIKLKIYLYSLIFISLAAFANFWHNIKFEFSTVEPETMMWYRFVFLDEKPYYSLLWLYLLVACVVALAQYLPERVRNRVKILTHLPISLMSSISLHVVTGFFFITIFSLFLGGMSALAIECFYPSPILVVMLKDTFFFYLGSIMLYLGLSAAILEKKPLFMAIKLFATLLVVWLFFQKHYEISDLLWGILVVTFFFLALDSLYSIKEQRFTKPYFYALSLLAVGFFTYQSVTIYTHNFSNPLTKFYLFYSPIKKDFVYQKNFGKHHFEYGIKDKKTFQREEYESYLPFVYWRNLDIQKKLPLVIDGKSYDKKSIKKSRLSFAYKPSYLEKLESPLYPLINPNSQLGMIKFPELALHFGRKKITAYHFDKNVDKEVTKEINISLKENGVRFPIQNVWGKFTNMKPYDLGMFFKDNKGEIFNLKQANDTISVKKINTPKDVNFVYMYISENKQKQLAGYAIDENSKVYIIDYKSLTCKAIDLPSFDYKSMNMQIISNPMYYLVRYDDTDIYHAKVFTKEFKAIKEVSFQ